MRVLIAEDDLISRKILAKFLAPYAETVLAANGDEALQCYEDALKTKAPFDAILLDMVMPFKDGIEVLELVRQKEAEFSGTQSKKVPVIMLTGQGDAVQINKAEFLGISDYMLKPVDEMKLIRELQRLEIIPDTENQWG